MIDELNEALEVARELTAHKWSEVKPSTELVNPLVTYVNGFDQPGEVSQVLVDYITAPQDEGRALSALWWALSEVGLYYGAQAKTKRWIAGDLLSRSPGFVRWLLHGDKDRWRKGAGYLTRYHLGGVCRDLSEVAPSKAFKGMCCLLEELAGPCGGGYKRGSKANWWAWTEIDGLYSITVRSPEVPRQLLHLRFKYSGRPETREGDWDETWVSIKKEVSTMRQASHLRGMMGMQIYRMCHLAEGRSWSNGRWVKGAASNLRYDAIDTPDHHRWRYNGDEVTGG